MKTFLPLVIVVTLSPLAAHAAKFDMLAWGAWDFTAASDTLAAQKITSETSRLYMAGPGFATLRLDVPITPADVGSTITVDRTNAASYGFDLDAFSTAFASRDFQARNLAIYTAERPSVTGLADASPDGNPMLAFQSFLDPRELGGFWWDSVEKITLSVILWDTQKPEPGQYVTSIIARFDMYATPEPSAILLAVIGGIGLIAISRPRKPRK